LPVHCDAGLLAGLDVLDLEITPVGHDRDAIHSEKLLCRFGGLGQEAHIATTWFVTRCSTISLCLASTAICTL
jgi:hypothetical protein